MTLERTINDEPDKHRAHSSKKLEPDYAELSSLSLFVVASIASGANVTALPTTADPRQFKPKSSHRAINALWFMSLTLSLLVSVFAILAKQWIVTFVARMHEPVGNLRRWAHRHRAYRDGWTKWSLGAFISSLSFALHVALLVFLVGLLVHTYALDVVVFAPVAALSALATLIYFATALAPLFDKTCPTETSLSALLRSMFLSSRKIFLYLLHEKLLHYLHRIPEPGVEPHAFVMEHLSIGLEPPAVVRLEQIVPDDQSNDVGVLAWMFNNLPAGEEVDVALDATTQLKKDHASRLVATAEQVSVLIQERLWNFSSVERGQDLAGDAASIARAIRAALCLERGRGKTSGFDQLILGLASVRTHDVPVLLRALAIQIQVAQSPEIFGSTPGTNQIVNLAELPVTEVHELCQLFEAWIPGTSLTRPMPISNDTHDIILELISQVSKRSIVLRIEHCIGLVLSLCAHRATNRWMALTTPAVVKAILSITPPHWDPPSGRQLEYQAMYVWAWLFEQFPSIQASGILDLVRRQDVARCFMVMAGSLEPRQVKWVFTEHQLQQLLAPFTSDVPGTGEALATGHTLLCMWLQRTETSFRTWKSGFAQVAFGVFDRLHHLQDPIPSYDIEVLLRAALPESLILAKLDFQRRIDVGTLHQVLEHSTLNLLKPRTSCQGATTSIWRIVVSDLKDSFRLRSLSKHVAIFCVLLNELHVQDASLNMAEHYEQLLGDGYGAKLILSAKPNSPDVFSIVHAVATQAPAQWTEIRTCLLASQWSTCGHEWGTPAELVAYVEGLGDNC